MKRMCWSFAVLGCCFLTWQVGHAAEPKSKSKVTASAKNAAAPKAKTSVKKEQPTPRPSARATAKKAAQVAPKTAPSKPAAKGSSSKKEAGSAPPAGDIYILPWKWSKGNYALGKPKNITKRPKGYDNQPSFVEDGTSLMFTSIRVANQADVYLYDLLSGRVVQLTNTPESEFSPTVAPPMTFISMVRVEKDKTQRLWKFTHSNSRLSLVLSKIKRVGYHAWFNKTQLALFIVGEKGKPHTLVTTDIKTQKVRHIANHVGRCLQSIPFKNKVSFVDKSDKTKWYIKSLDPKTGKVTTLIKTLPGQEDYAWTPRGQIIMGHGPRLFLWKPGTPKKMDVDCALETSQVFQDPTDRNQSKEHSHRLCGAVSFHPSILCLEGRFFD